MQLLKTTELAQHVETLYDKVKSVTVSEGVFAPLNVHFRENDAKDCYGFFLLYPGGDAILLFTFDPQFGR